MHAETELLKHERRRYIFIRDKGSVDELLHSGRTFRGFKAGHQGVDLGIG